jgi:hypothetical protein
MVEEDSGEAGFGRGGGGVCDGGVWRAGEAEVAGVEGVGGGAGEVLRGEGCGGNAGLAARGEIEWARARKKNGEGEGRSGQVRRSPRG